MSTTTLTHGRVTWINILNPTAQDISAIGQRFPQIHPLNLEDFLTELEVPKVDQQDDYLFVVFQMPYWDAHERLSRPAEVDIFITRGVLITSHRGQLPPLTELFNAALLDQAERERLMGQGASPLLYTLLNSLVDYCFPILGKVGHNLRRIENTLFGVDTRHTLIEVSTLRRDIIALRHILKPQIAVVHQLEVGNWEFIHEDLDLYWHNIIDHLEQIRSTLEEYTEVIGGLSETIDTLASHHIDEVVRLLTVITILSLPVTLLTTIFGMNILLPYGQHPLLFFILLGSGLFLSLALVWYLHRRRWL